MERIFDHKNDLSNISLSERGIRLWTKDSGKNQYYVPYHGIAQFGMENGNLLFLELKSGSVIKITNLTDAGSYFNRLCEEMEKWNRIRK